MIGDFTMRRLVELFFMLTLLKFFPTTNQIELRVPFTIRLQTIVVSFGKRLMIVES